MGRGAYCAGMPWSSCHDIGLPWLGPRNPSAGDDIALCAVGNATSPAGRPHSRAIPLQRRTPDCASALAAGATNTVPNTVPNMAPSTIEATTRMRDRDGIPAQYAPRPMGTRRVWHRSVVVVVLVLVVGAALAACSDGGSSSSRSGPGKQASITGTMWVLDTQALVRGAGNITVTAQFTDTQISGESGCNRYFGSSTVNQANGSMSINGIGGTRIACTGAANDVEQAYLTALSQVGQYRATSDTLRLLDAGGKVLLRYQATDAAKAIQGDWVVTSFYTCDALVSPVQGSTLTAKFDAKQISGEAGCNSFSGEYTVNGDTISIGTLASTLRACADPAVDAQEAKYLQALALAKTFTVTGDRLDLFREDGGFAVSYQKK